jgi:hypothetical protein
VSAFARGPFFERLSVFGVAGMHHIEIECGHRCAVKDGAYTAHDDKVNAMPGQDFQYFGHQGFELCTEGEQRVYLILEDGEALARSQGKHSADQRQIDAIIAVPGAHGLSLLRAFQAIPRPGQMDMCSTCLYA